MARPKPHHTSTWPWSVRRGDWHNTARYAEDPPLFTSGWLHPVRQGAAHSTLHARQRHRHLLGCINDISVFTELRWGKENPTCLDDLPSGSQYLQICRNQAGVAIVGPDEPQYDECSAAIRTGALIPTNLTEVSRTLRYDDIPPDTLRAAAEIIDAPIRPDATGRATIADRPHRRIGQDERDALRALKISTAPAGKRSALLVHVWETYAASLSPRKDVRAGPWELRHINPLPSVPAVWYDQFRPALHKRLPRAGRIPVLFGDDGQGKRGIWMSTSDLELATMSDSLEECRGHVLVAGLGLGIFPTLAAQKDDVKSVTVVEIADHIVDISADYVARQGVRVVQDSIEDFASRPPVGTPKFDYCFVDIWPYIQDPYENEAMARATVSDLMAKEGRVSVWCQALNDRKHRSMELIGLLGAGAISPAQPGQTCYSCADDMASSVAGMCIQCALGAWRGLSELSGQDFPIAPDEVPEVAAVREAQRALAGLEPELLAEMVRPVRHVQKVI